MYSRITGTKIIINDNLRNQNYRNSMVTWNGIFVILIAGTVAIVNVTRSGIVVLIIIDQVVLSHMSVVSFFMVKLKQITLSIKVITNNLKKIHTDKKLLK